MINYQLKGGHDKEYSMDFAHTFRTSSFDSACDDHDRYTTVPSHINKRYKLFKKFTIGFFITSFLLFLSLIYIVCSLINPFFVQDFMIRTFQTNGVGFPTHRHGPFKKFMANVQFLNKDREVLPIHSHNDYLRKHPLFDALRLGVNSVEADVWNVQNTRYLSSRSGSALSLDVEETYEDGNSLDDNTLYVGHHKVFLSSYRTLESLYAAPIESLLDSVNSKNLIKESSSQKLGVFYNDPFKTLYLIIDIKNDPEIVFNKIQESLKSLQLKNYLTTYNTNTKEWSYGPLTIIISGLIPYDQIKLMELRNCFIDAPLTWFQESTNDTSGPNDTYTSELSIFGSASLEKITGSKKALANNDGLSAEQLQALKQVIDRAHDRGIKARIWETPSWPIVQRDKVWSQLLELGVDSLNVDDLQGAVHRF